MGPEQNGHAKYQEEQILKSRDTLVVNNTVCLNFEIIENKPVIKICKRKAPGGIHYIESKISHFLGVPNLKITTESNSPELAVTISSENQISTATVQNFPDFIYKKSKYWRDMKKEATRTSNLLQGIIARLND